MRISPITFKSPPGLQEVKKRKMAPRDAPFTVGFLLFSHSGRLCALPSGPVRATPVCFKMKPFHYLFMFLTKARQGLNPCSLFGFVVVATDRPPFLGARHGCIFFWSPPYYLRIRRGAYDGHCVVSVLIFSIFILTGLRRLLT